ncbi:membrane protein [Actinomycetes bacterium]|nr:membrane protein [Actinomycetes bacterium]
MAKKAKVAKTPKAPKTRRSKPEWMRTLGHAYAVARKAQPLVGVWIALAFVAVLSIGVVIGFVLGHPIYVTFLSIPISLLAALFLFSRIAERAAYASIEGQLGAGASVLMSIKKGLHTVPGVAANRNQDVVHRSISRAGVVISGEGGQAVRTLMTDERRKMERFMTGVPVYEVLIGDGEGRVPIRKLQKHVNKLPKKLSKAQYREAAARMRSLGGPNVPLPKGPMPNMRKVPKR